VTYRLGDTSFDWMIGDALVISDVISNGGIVCSSSPCLEWFWSPPRFTSGLKLPEHEAYQTPPSSETSPPLFMMVFKHRENSVFLYRLIQVHCHVHKYQPPVPILSHFIPIRNLVTCSLKVHISLLLRLGFLSFIFPYGCEPEVLYTFVIFLWPLHIPIVSSP
jgi:hypothetical protein